MAREDGCWVLRRCCAAVLDTITFNARRRYGELEGGGEGGVRLLVHLRGHGTPPHGDAYHELRAMSAMALREVAPFRPGLRVQLGGRRDAPAVSRRPAARAGACSCKGWPTMAISTALSSAPAARPPAGGDPVPARGRARRAVAGGHL